MFYVFIIMTIFSVMILLYGVQLRVCKNPLLPATYHGKRTKSYLNYLGKTVMYSALSPFLCGLVALLGESPVIIFLSGITLIVSFIIIMYYSVKNNKEQNR
ncbi:MAG: hypothetical protein Q4E69_06760 [Bacilli bacterium]|nr:hypothetical protein [Bacilli bacterium]